MPGSVRDYAILWVGAGKGSGGGNVALGGNALLTTAQHKLDGVEHLAADDTTRLDATVDEHGLLPKLSGSATDALLGDGTWGPVGLVVDDEGLPLVGSATELDFVGPGVTASGGTPAKTVRVNRWEPHVDYLGSVVLDSAGNPVMQEIYS